MQGLSEADIERHRELAHVGARGAANALGALANTSMLTRVPVVYGPERFCVRSEWTTGIFCDFAGDLSGTVGVFLCCLEEEV